MFLLQVVMRAFLIKIVVIGCLHCISGVLLYREMVFNPLPIFFFGVFSPLPSCFDSIDSVWRCFLVERISSGKAICQTYGYVRVFSFGSVLVFLSDNADRT